MNAPRNILDIEIHESQEHLAESRDVIELFEMSCADLRQGAHQLGVYTVRVLLELLRYTGPLQVHHHFGRRHEHNVRGVSVQPHWFYVESPSLHGSGGESLRIDLTSGIQRKLVGQDALARQVRLCQQSIVDEHLYQGLSQDHQLLCFPSLRLDIKDRDVVVQ